MKILGIEHIGIAVENIDQSAPFWKTILGISLTTNEEVKEQGIVTDIFDTGKGKVELLEATSPDSPIAKFIEKRGQGIHHICFQVDDIHGAIRELINAGVNVISEEPKVGAEGYLVTFIHPKSTGGVLVELAEKPL